MKVQTTEEYADICVRVPLARAEDVRGAIEKILALIEPSSAEAEEKEWYSVEDVFPEGIRPGEVLAGVRYREGLTQARLAAMIGVKPHHISEMEKGKRPIGKEMALRLSKALNIGPKVFLPR
jgi:antitoxin component HigA of HigAB toxin-antitoxin module